MSSAEVTSNQHEQPTVEGGTANADTGMPSASTDGPDTSTQNASVESPEVCAQTKTTTEKTSESLVARSYQIELLNHVTERNSIICMGTGTGKTFVAIMLIKEKAHEIQKPFDEGGKRTFFLTNAVALARQQGDVIRQHTNLKVQTYVGADGVDQWMQEPGRWETEFRRNQVLVMTAQILLNILQHGLLPFSRINLIIFDECHHAKKNHAYVKIMEIGREACENGEPGPHVLGLTASILDSDVSTSDALENKIATIEQKLNSVAVTSADTAAMEMYGTKPEESILECERYDNSGELTTKLLSVFDPAFGFVQRCEFAYKNRKIAEESSDILAGELPVGLETVIKDFEDYIAVLNILGPIAANFVAGRYLDKLKKETKTNVIPVEVNRRFFCLGYTVFLELEKIYEEYDEENIQSLEDAEALCAPKVRTLIKEVLYHYGDHEVLEEEEEEAVPGGMEDDLDAVDVLGDDEEEDDDDDIIVEEVEEDICDDLGDEEEEEDEEDEENGDDEPVIDTEAPLPNENLTGIIFVERRITSFALHKLLEKFFGWDAVLCCLHSGYIVGAGGKGETRDIQQTAKHQEATLRAFHSKHLNLLVSTSVLQEGIDIPKCNLVVLFDPPKNFREYVQAKGRARAASSKFYVMAIENELDECAHKLKKYQAFEDVIASKCLNRDETKEEVVEDIDDYLPPYKGPKMDQGSLAMIFMSSAVGIINTYCSHLPTDSYTKLAPSCTYKQIPTSANTMTFQCTMQLPMNSPVREPVTGPVMPRKKLAQMATALKICELLHKAGELTDHFLPAYRGVEDLDEVLQTQATGGASLDTTGASSDAQQAIRPRPNTNKQKHLYSKRYAQSIANCLPKAGKPLYMYEITMTMTAVTKDLDDVPKPSEETERGFAILLDKALPSIPDFPIYIKTGELTITLKLIKSTLTLNDDGLDKCLTFHRYIWSKVLNIEREHFISIIFSPEEGQQQIVLVPITKGEIDWEFVDYILSKKDLPYLTYGKKFVWDEEQWKDAVVTRTYREPPAFYHINEICKDMNPYSKFPNDAYISFHDYYFTRYEGLKIRNKTQPLLDVTSISKRLNLLTPRHLSRIGQALPTTEKERHLTHFVPELCGIHIFPGTMWRKAMCLPSIMYRLNCLLNAAELRERVRKEAGICTELPPEGHTYPRLDFGHKLQGELRPIGPDGEAKPTEEQIKKEDEEKMDIVKKMLEQGAGESEEAEYEDSAKKREHNERKAELEKIEHMGIFDEYLNIPDARFGPSPCHILHALTMCAANDFFSLERMELMGDSFLKYVVTVYLYFKYPNIHEGKLTNRRTALTNNSNLHKLGCDKKIEEIMVSSQFAPNDNFLPPCYKVKDEDKTIVREGKRGEEDEYVAFCMRTKHQLMEKQVADCIEALIGCYLITSGAKATRGFISWLGLNITIDKETMPIPDPLFKTVPGWADMLEKHTADLHVFEESIQYSFKNKGYLLEALTHASYEVNRVTECYQRMEFLGDAILDYIITRFMFEDCKQHSPGLMTDIRSALVCNNTFAKLAVKYKYHLSFKYRSPELFFVIDRFVKAQEELKNEIQPDIDSLLDDEIVIPKALGDIFESVAGAIYLDSGLSLDTVWEVYYRMMKDLIVDVSISLPKSPIRELMELAPGLPTFSRPMRVAPNKMKVQVVVPGKGTFTGIGKNHRVARVAAAKAAVHKLREIQAAGFFMKQV